MLHLLSSGMCFSLCMVIRTSRIFLGPRLRWDPYWADVFVYLFGNHSSWWSKFRVMQVSRDNWMFVPVVLFRGVEKEVLASVTINARNMVLQLLICWYQTRKYFTIPGFRWKLVSWVWYVINCECYVSEKSLGPFLTQVYWSPSVLAYWWSIWSQFIINHDNMIFSDFGSNT